jgi:hypothetical protein
MIAIGIGVFLVVFYLFGPLASFSFALVIGTLLLAWVTAFLASAPPFHPSPRPMDSFFRPTEVD